MYDVYNEHRITKTAATLLNALGIEKHPDMDDAHSAVLAKMKDRFSGKDADRLFIYNPDAVALWLYQKYTHLFEKTMITSDMAFPVLSVMPSVTPVCFASMYSGMLPEKHGIRKYEKPVLTVPTFYDEMVKAGKKVAIVCTDGDSISRIFLERDVEYYFYPTVAEVNEKAEELINENRHDAIVVYNGNFDYTMHKNGPEAEISLEQIAKNGETYQYFINLIKEKWADKNVMFGFLPDHGCHEIDGDCGSHGLDMTADMNIIHFYGFKPQKA